MPPNDRVVPEGLRDFVASTAATDDTEIALAGVLDRIQADGTPSGPPDEVLDDLEVGNDTVVRLQPSPTSEEPKRRWDRVAVGIGLAAGLAGGLFGMSTAHTNHELESAAGLERARARGAASERDESEQARRKAERTLNEERQLVAQMEAVAGKQDTLLTELIEEHAERKAEEAPPRSTPRRSAWDAWRRGRAAYEAGDRAEARRQFEAALQHDPRHAAAFNSLGRIEADEGNDEAAEVLFRRALRSEANNRYALVNLATLKRYQGDLPAAEELLSRALAVDPDYEVAKKKLSRLRQLQERSRAKKEENDG